MGDVVNFRVVKNEQVLSPSSVQSIDWLKSAMVAGDVIDIAIVIRKRGGEIYSLSDISHNGLCAIVQGMYELATDIAHGEADQ